MYDQRAQLLLPLPFFQGGIHQPVILAHVMGSLLHYTCWFDRPGGHQKVEPAKKLNILFTEVQKEYTEHKVGRRLTNLTLNMFCNPKQPHATHPMLHCKGAECKHLGEAPPSSPQKDAWEGEAYTQQHAVLLAVYQWLDRPVGQVWHVFVQQWMEKTMKLHKDFVMEYKLLGEWGSFAPHQEWHGLGSRWLHLGCRWPQTSWWLCLATSAASLPALRVLHSAERIVLGGGSQSQNTPERVLLSSSSKLLNGRTCFSDPPPCFFDPPPVFLTPTLFFWPPRLVFLTPPPCFFDPSSCVGTCCATHLCGAYCDVKDTSLWLWLFPLQKRPA